MSALGYIALGALVSGLLTYVALRPRKRPSLEWGTIPRLPTKVPYSGAVKTKVR